MAVTDLAPESSRHAHASDPSAHVWVSASAGTGKTRSLVDRVTRLLLAGAAPSSLFAITFTKTAAAEMQKRVLERLAKWARMPDAELDAALRDLGETPSGERRSAASALFLRVLDAPEGLQIRTIHAAAQSLLAAFPLEAGLPPRADPLDERAAARLRQQALTEALEEAAGPAGASLRADLARVAVEAGEQALETHLATLLRSEAGYREIGPPHAVEPWLRRWLGLPVEPSAEELMEETVMPPAFDDGAVTDFRPVVAARKHTWAAGALDFIDRWSQLGPVSRVTALSELVGLVWTSKGEPRSVSKIKLPDAQERFDRLFDEVMKVVDRGRALAFIAHAGAWLRIGMAVEGRYRRLKRAAAAVDFDDMVALAAALLEEDGMAGFVAKKLDRRIAHVLVDEAQDTNEAQWRLIDGLTADFDSGEGAHGDALRTRFVVGDFKQAIFRFQGTDPEVFLCIRERWGRIAAGAGHPIRDVPLDTNFRSAPLILGLVDSVLTTLGPAAIGLPAGQPLPRHIAYRCDLPARVVLFPPHVRDEALPDEPPPEEAGEAEEDPIADPRFAERIATAIASMVAPDSPDRLILSPRGGAPRPAGPGDVLILVQARGDLMTALVRALHGVGLPVAGVDRARLSAPIAAKDLLSLLRFVLQPADDLALAELLVSPLGGLDHEAIRHVRAADASLWERVAASTDPALGPVQALLRAALAAADFTGPHAFLQRVLHAGGRAAFRARLGPEADDAIDGLLAEALAFEANRPATLEGFLAHLGEADDEVRRDPDASPGLVRLMTVHGAKGLEAPIVVLADTLRQHRPTRSVVLWRSADRRASLPLVYFNKDRKPEKVATLVEEAEAAEAAEHNRLLYVAMTRAEQVLLVAGQISPTSAKARANNPDGLDCWHDRIRRAMEEAGGTRRETEPLGPHLVLEDGTWPAPADARPAEASGEVPLWARVPPPPEPAPVRPFTPSQPAADEAPLPPPGPGQAAAAARGRLIHRLFEKLPAVSPDARTAVADRVIAAAGMVGADATAVRDEVLAVLADPSFAPLFHAQALAEAPIAGEVDGHVVSGTVDRLLATDALVRVADFKTGLVVPAAAADVHRSHLRQMAAYRAVLRAAFPGKRVEAALVYTAGPKLLLLPDEILDAHWPPAVP